ncbi:MAG TPA: GlxA family transcriptional regulator [Geminicoccaceae bacterium]|nr:GlxA family transcriptional regulator [Geminicoccaceae bacterium]
MFATEPRSLPEVIAFFLVPNFSMIAFGSALEPLRLANRLAERELYRWHLVSRDGGPVRASNGVSVNSDSATAEVGPGRRVPAQSIVLCAGLTAERYADREVFGWLHRCDRQGVEIGALCTGAHVLARAGLLDGYRCTIHWENLPGFIEAFPDIQVSADLFEIDRNRFTCSGGTSALDMMLHLIASQHGAELATKVSEQCLLDRMRGPHDHQRLPLRVRLGVHHPRLIKSIEIMEANLEEPLDQEELARYVGLSRRQLERLFAAHLGRTPARFYLEQRLGRARRLLYQTDMAVIDVALACGFVSASHFSKCYRQMYGKTPREERGRAAA